MSDLNYNRFPGVTRRFQQNDLERHRHRRRKYHRRGRLHLQ
jgi:hypothetical protein